MSSTTELRTTATPAASGPPDVVISAAYGVGPDYVRTFLRTFRSVNQSARIILLVWDRGPLREIAEEYDAELDRDNVICRNVPRMSVKLHRPDGSSATKKVRVSELLGRSTRLAPRLAHLFPEPITRSLVSPALSRFFHIRDILAGSAFGQVLLSDSRDVFFQANPFATRERLVMAEESGRFGEDPFNTKWYSDGFGEEEYQKVVGKPVYCSGTILGSRDAMLEHVSKLCDRVKRLRTWKHGGIDQAVHNFVARALTDPGGYSTSATGQGSMATIRYDSKLNVTDGVILNDDGSKIPIIHQYDRLPADVVASLRMLRP